MESRNHSTAFIRVENKQKEDNTLPKSYGRTEAFLLPKDPEWMYMFWEITPATYDYIKQQNGWDIFDKSKAVVRLHNVTDVRFDGGNSHEHWDISVIFDALSWYLQVPKAGESYVAELGLVTPEGNFILIARSNPTATPPGKISDVLDQRWMIVEDNFQKLLTMSGAGSIGLGASERLQILQDSWTAVLGQLNVAAPSSFQSSNMSSKSFLGADVPAAEEDDMWLKADCEIIVYGSASPGAKVTINGKEIELKNGSFSIRQSLHKGQVLDLPIRATKNNMERNVKIKAERED